MNEYESLSECMKLHDETTDNTTGSQDGSSFIDGFTQWSSDFLWKNSDALEKAATNAATNALKEEANKLLGGGGNNPVKSDNGIPSKNDTSETSATQKAKGFLSTSTGAGVLGASVATGAYIAIPKKNKNRVLISVVAGALTGAGTYYATK